MKTSRLAALFLITVSWTAGLVQAQEQERPKIQPPVPVVPPIPDVQDFTTLRLAFAAQPDFSPFWQVDPEREAIMKAVESKDYPKAVALAGPWLKKVPVDAEMHFIRGQLLQRAGDIPGSLHHLHCYYGLLSSITASGDGKTAKTAYKVISVSEEYDVLHEINAEVLQQSLETPCDKMHVKLADGTETDLYFDVSVSLAASTRLLNPEKK